MTPQADQAWNAGASSAKRRAVAYVSYAASFMLLPLSGLLAARLFSGLLESSLAALLFTGAGLIFVVITQFLLAIVAEAFLVPSGHDVCERDSRAPVLFLRPFGEDKPLTYDMISTGDTAMAVTASAEDFLLPLNAIGPLISVSEPGWLARQGFHRLGAFRDYVDAGQWQCRVQRLLDQAGIVVLAIGDSPGIEWEIAEVRKRIRPESLIVYLPPRPASAFTRGGRSRKEELVYEQFKPMILRHFGIELPSFSESLYVIGFHESGALIMAPDAARTRWALSEHHRVADAVTSQLQAVVAKMRPDIDLNRYRVPGRAAALWRLCAATGAFIGAVGIGVWFGA